MQRRPSAATNRAQVINSFPSLCSCEPAPSLGICAGLFLTSCSWQASLGNYPEQTSGEPSRNLDFVDCSAMAIDARISEVA